MRSAIVAMLWENWRLSRVEAAQRFAVGILAGSAAMTLFDAGVAAAFTILIAIHAFFWFSIAKLNGGRFVDGYKPGFPLYLLYTRPVPTGVFVGVAMAYDALSGVALYLISAALLELAFGQPLPLFSVALMLVTIHFVFICIQWSTRSRSFQWIGSLAVTAPLFILIKNRATSSMQAEFSLVENALMVLICVVSFGLTVAGVARQRRGDSEVSAPRMEVSGAYPDWIINVFRFQCPTSSATRAQVWFELRSSGLPVLTIGLVAAVLIFLLFALGIPFTPVRQAAIGIPVLSVPVLIGLSANAFGIRRRQGRSYLSAFEATQPYGTAQMAGLKILVRALCLLLAMTAIGLSVWTSSSLISAWGEWMMEGNDNSVGLLRFRGSIGEAFSKMPGYVFAALALIAAIATAITVASLAAFTALRLRYLRRMLVAVATVLFYGFALVLLAWSVKRGVAPDSLLHATLTATTWIGGAALACATFYLLWSGFAERVLTIPYVSGALMIPAAIAAVIGAAWLAGIPAPSLAGMLWTFLSILMVAVLAPWALSRIRRL